MTDLESAKLDPSKCFKRPNDVVKDASLTHKQKVEILKRWAYDEREISVAEEENMQSEDNSHASILDEVLKALLDLGVGSDDAQQPPTKQG